MTLDMSLCHLELCWVGSSSVLPDSTGLSGSGATEVSQMESGQRAGLALVGREQGSCPAGLGVPVDKNQAGIFWKRTACCQLSPAQGTLLCVPLPGQGCRRSSDFAAGRGGVKGNSHPFNAFHLCTSREGVLIWSQFFNGGIDRLPKELCKSLGRWAAYK